VRIHIYSSIYGLYYFRFTLFRLCEIGRNDVYNVVLSYYFQFTLFRLCEIARNDVYNVVLYSESNNLLELAKILYCTFVLSS